MVEIQTVILAAIVVLLAFVVCILVMDKNVAQVEQCDQNIAAIEARHEIEINQTWDDGWYNGYEWGTYDVVNLAMESGLFYYNENLSVYSPEGCKMFFGGNKA